MPIETKAIVSKSVSAIQSEAKRLAQMVDETFSTQVEQTFEAREIMKRAGLVWLLELRRVYSDEEMDSLPVPGTDTGNNPDKYKRSANTGTGERQSPVGAFYLDWFDETPMGKHINGQIKAIKDAKSKAVGADLTLNDNVPKRDAMLNKWEARRTNGVTQVRLAVNIWLKMRSISEYLPNVEVEFLTTGEDNNVEVMATTTPIRVYGTVKPHNSYVYSIGSFLQLKPSVAAEKAGNTGDQAAALDATTAREPNGPQTYDWSIKDIPSFNYGMSELSNLLDNGKTVTALIVALNKTDSDADYEHIFTVYEALQGIVSKYPNRMRKISEAKAEAMAKAGYNIL